MNINWGVVLVILSTMWIWYAIFTIGFFHTLFWVLMGSVIGGLYTKYKYKDNN